MAKFKNMKRDDNATSAQSALAGDILAGYVDHHDEIPEGTRIVVIVSSGTDKGRIGCAFEGYEEDEQLMLDLQMLAQAVDLGGTT
jgi:hypothetical protein